MQWGRGCSAGRNKTPDASRPDPSQEDGDDVYLQYAGYYAVRHHPDGSDANVGLDIVSSCDHRRVDRVETTGKDWLDEGFRPYGLTMNQYAHVSSVIAVDNRRL